MGVGGPNGSIAHCIEPDDDEDDVVHGLFGAAAASESDEVPGIGKGVIGVAGVASADGSGSDNGDDSGDDDELCGSDASPAGWSTSA
jgi:hypothetical protein